MSVLMVFIFPPDTIDRSPSIRIGLPPDCEYECRAYGARLIHKTCTELKCSPRAAIASQLLFQFFYCIKTFIHYDVRAVVPAFITLGCKVEEFRVSLHDVVNGCLLQQALEDGVEHAPLDESADLSDILQFEAAILMAFGHRVHDIVKSAPHLYMLKIIESLPLSVAFGGAKTQALAKLSWAYAMDMLNNCGWLCCLHEPQETASACIYLASLDLKLPLGTSWFGLFGVGEDGAGAEERKAKVQDIAREILQWGKQFNELETPGYIELQG